jgi:hypothetical protein
MSNKKAIIIISIFLISFFSTGLRVHYNGASVAIYNAVSSARVDGGIS